VTHLTNMTNPSFTLWIAGTPTTFTSAFADLALAYKALDASSNRSSFARDLLAGARARKLSKNQIAWLHWLATEATKAPVVVPRVGPGARYPQTAQLLWAAGHAGKLYPKLKMRTQPTDGAAAVEYTLKLRTSGEIVILQGDSYAGRIAADACAFLAPRYEQDVRALLEAVEASPAEFARQHGVATGRCMFCGRLLATKESRFAGYGPDCADKFGMPWGEVSEEFEAEGKL
jgi:hypothetical protein